MCFTCYLLALSSSLVNYPLREGNIWVALVEAIVKYLVTNASKASSPDGMIALTHTYCDTHAKNRFYNANAV